VRDRHARVGHVQPPPPLAAERPEAVVAAKVGFDSEGDAEGGRGHRVGSTPVEPLDGRQLHPELGRREVVETKS
jgi:hypothetical protein